MTCTLHPVGLGCLLTMAAVLAACSSPSTSAATSAGTTAAQAATPAHTVEVVASTDVWGNVVSAIGGVDVKVTSLISDPAADPHSYEANAQNQLAISKADLIVENGGGYDDFVDRMVSSAKAKATVLDAVEISGYTAPSGGDVNEHVWYDFPTVNRVAVKIETALAAADPTAASTFAANTKAFTARVAILQQKESAVKAKSAGVGVAITEPVPLYMLLAAGLDNKTPPAFSAAIESDNDAPAAVVAQTLALFTDHQVKALVYNEQTTGPQTEQVLAAAKANGIAVVPVTETLPGGVDYLTWMGANLDAIAAAVS